MQKKSEKGMLLWLTVSEITNPGCHLRVSRDTREWFLFLFFFFFFLMTRNFRGSFLKTEFCQDNFVRKSEKGMLLWLTQGLWGMIFFSCFYKITRNFRGSSALKIWVFSGQFYLNKWLFTFFLWIVYELKRLKLFKTFV